MAARAATASLGLRRSRDVRCSAPEYDVVDVVMLSGGRSGSPMRGRTRLEPRAWQGISQPRQAGVWAWAKPVDLAWASHGLDAVMPCLASTRCSACSQPGQGVRLAQQRRGHLLPASSSHHGSRASRRSLMPAQDHPPGLPAHTPASRRSGEP
ncbi:hypothetical protein, partial [Escherichia coli]|uniref:hypothetical protein n=1 Tax=Escherichia coli TaxID=562 RepID=UPI001BC8BF94